MSVPLTAICPIDGRYYNKTKELQDYFSEFALIKYRLQVEIEYFIAICGLGIPQLKVSQETFNKLRGIYQGFTIEEAKKVKEFESATNHDIKAIEYYIKSKFDHLGLKPVKEFVHFGLTSQDINNTAIPLLLKDFFDHELFLLYDKLKETFEDLYQQWLNIPMLSRTHGQPASPTKLGKEMMVYYERVYMQLYQMEKIPFSAKFGGAVGNFNAHQVAFPNVNWPEFADNFIKQTLGLYRSQFTTQIEHYDNLASLFDATRRINNILIDFDRDMWYYISLNYFGLRVTEQEVGSSTMPHKINPINFENSEGNLQIANGLLQTMANKLPISRLQRDLSDSTVLRNIGVAFAYTIIGIKSLLTGISKLEVNQEMIQYDLDSHWSVITEGIQTILRREGYSDPYELMKQFTRNNEINQETISALIDQLKVSDSVKSELRAITPSNYTGVF